MLNDVLVAQGVLNGLRVIGNAAIAAALFLTLGVALHLASRRLEAAGRARLALRVLSSSFVTLAALIVAALALVIGLSAWRTRAQPRHWDLDLTGRASLRSFQIDKCAEWRIGATVNVDCIVEGAVSLSARFPKGRTVRESGRVLWASGEGDELTSLHLFLSPMSATELETRLGPLFAAWEVPPAALAEWRSEGTGRRRYFTTREDRRDLPWLEVSVSSPDSQRHSERPFVASLKWHWTPRSPG